MIIYHNIWPCRPCDKPIATVHVGDCSIEDEIELCHFITQHLHVGKVFFCDWLWNEGQGVVRVEANPGVPMETLDIAVKSIIEQFVNIKNNA